MITFLIGVFMGFFLGIILGGILAMNKDQDVFPGRRIWIKILSFFGNLRAGKF